MSVEINLDPYFYLSTENLFTAVSQNIDNDRLEDAENALNILRDRGNLRRLTYSQQYKVDMLAIRILKAYLAQNQIANAKRVANRVHPNLMSDEDLKKMYSYLEVIFMRCIIQ